MFKTILLLMIISFNFVQAKPAIFESIQSLKASSMQEVVDALEEIGEEFESQEDMIIYADTLSYENSTNKRLDKLVREYIWRNFTGYSTPEELSAYKANMNEVRKLINSNLTGYLEEYRSSDRLLKNIEVLKKALLKANQYESIEIFELYHGNSFGGCSGLVLVDTYYEEMAYLQSCYSE